MLVKVQPILCFRRLNVDIYNPIGIFLRLKDGIYIVIIMKKVLLFIGAIMLVPTIVDAQSKAETTTEIRRDNRVIQDESAVQIIPYVKEYAISNPKKLATHFKSGVIPTSFPKFDPSLSEKENKKKVIEWAGVEGNRGLVKDESLVIFDEKARQFEGK